HLALEVVLRLDDAHRAGLRAHDHRMGSGAGAEPAHAPQHGAVGDAGGGEHHLALGHVEDTVFAIEVGDAPLLRTGALVVVAEEQAALHLAPNAAKGGGGQHALRRTTAANINIAAAVRLRCGDDATDVAVGNDHDPGAGGAHARDQLGMARTVEDADDDVGDLSFLGLGEFAQVLLGLFIEIDDAFRKSDTNGDLV